MRRYMRRMIGAFLAAVLLALPACGRADVPDGTDTTTPSVTETAPRVPQVELCAFEAVRFEGECHTSEHLEEYLAHHLDDLLADMSAHGITVDDGTEIRATPIHIINLLTGSVGLHAHFLPVLERGALVNAVSVNITNEAMTVSAGVSWPWMAQVDSVLKANPQETYLLANCLIGAWNYICLISSQNDVTYIVRPTGGGDLPFESGVDYFGKLYDERLVVSYQKIYGP